jgi:hypothetical protein
MQLIAMEVTVMSKRPFFCPAPPGRLFGLSNEPKPADYLNFTQGKRNPHFILPLSGRYRLTLRISTVYR